MRSDDDTARGPGARGLLARLGRLRRPVRTAPAPGAPGTGVVGVGIDVAAVTRFGEALERNPGLADRLFTPAELRLPSGARRGAASLAARFAAKEAVAKVLGAPGGLRWHDTEVRTGPGGRPALHVRGSVAAEAARHGIRSWHLSLTHDAGVASAVVIASA